MKDLSINGVQCSINKTNIFIKIFVLICCADSIKQMRKMVKSKSPIQGVKNPSPLINLINFDIIFGCVPESMHCVAGIAKQFATMWFGNSKKVEFSQSN